MITPFDELLIGQWYTVGMRYRSANNRMMEREMRAQFLAVGDFNELLFNLRPLAGTQAVPKEWITRLEPTSEHTPMIPRKPVAS